METAPFRKLIDDLATRHGYARSKAKSAWFRDMPTIVVTLELQRSSYGRQYFLNINFWLRALLAQPNESGKDLKGSGHIFRREDSEYSDALDLENTLVEPARTAKLESLFGTFLEPLVVAMSSREGILDCANSDPPKVFLLPKIRAHLSA